MVLLSMRLAKHGGGRGRGPGNQVFRMEIAAAAEMLRVDSMAGTKSQTWCDLGCGTGTFTLALATLLPPGSVIHAIDKDEASLAQIPERYEDVTIHKSVAELHRGALHLPPSNGVLMANFLHYIEDQEALFDRLRPLPEQLLIVEYENRPRNPWVPYSIEFPALRELLVKRGFTEVERVATRPSRFGGRLYSAFAESAMQG